MFKKLIPIILAILLLAACSQSEVALLEFIDTSPIVYNYDGKTIIMDGGPYFHYQDDNSPQTDALRQRLANIQKELNLTFEYCEKGRTTIASIIGDVYTADIIYRWEGSSLVDFAYSNVLYPMTDFPEFIDLSDTDKYGTPGATEAALAKGIPYGIQPTYWPGMQGTECFFITYNKNMLGEMGLTDLHEYYENETWVWDTFYNFLEQSETLIPDNTTTYQAHSAYLMNTIFLSNGFDYFYIVDGKPEFNIMTNDAIQSIEFMQKLSKLEKVRITSSRWDIEDFVKGNSLTTMATAKDVTVGDIPYESEFDYGIMPFPCGPDTEYGKWAQSVTRIYGFAIPTSSPNPNIAAHVLSKMFEPFEEFGTTRELLQEFYANSIFLTKTDADIYFAVDKNVRYDYDDLGLVEGFVGAIANGAKSGTKSPSELLQTYSSVAKKLYDEYIEPNLTGYLIETMNITE